MNFFLRQTARCQSINPQFFVELCKPRLRQLCEHDLMTLGAGPAVKDASPMEAYGPTSRPLKWAGRIGSVKFGYVACTAVVCGIVVVLWSFTMMLSQTIFAAYPTSSSLFLLGALSGLGALGMSYVVEARERATVMNRESAGLLSGRLISTMLLAAAYLAMVAAFVSFWV